MIVDKWIVGQLESHSNDDQLKVVNTPPCVIGKHTCATVYKIVLFVCLTVNGLHAQAQEVAPVTIAWAEARPLFYADQSGEPTGFGIDLAKALGEEVGFTPEFFKVDSFAQWGEAQASGRSMLLPGAARLPHLAATNSFLEPIFTTNVVLAVRAEQAENFNSSDLTGLRIATVPPGIGSDSSLFPEAQVVEHNGLSDALVALLSGSVDAISAAALLVFNTAQGARLDNRIAFVGDAIAQDDRVVVLHESRVELSEPINAALARMEADGRLQALRSKHGLILPEPAPDVLSVGVTDFPPYSIQNDDGTFSGFAVESLRKLADLTNLNLTFEAISDAAFSAGPASDTYDVLPQAGISDSRLQVMDFTLPTERFKLAIFTRIGEAEGLSDLDSLIGKKVGVEAVNVARRHAQNHGELDMHVVEGRAALLSALANGTVDAVLFPSNAMNVEIERQDLADSITEIDPPFEIIERAPALRRGLGSIRERLNAVIPGYLLSDEYIGLREQYFGQPGFWTNQRIVMASASIATLFLGLLGTLVWQRQRQRQRQREYELQQRELALEQQHNLELSTLVSELERSNRELDDFAYTASHDLKEPLRGIAINANFLGREAAISEAAQERIERMVKLTTRMEQLISDILFFSRLGRGEAEATDIDLDTIIEGIRVELREWMTQRSAQFVVDGELPGLVADRSKIKTLFQNLIVNGLKYNQSEHKTVTIGYQDKAVVNGIEMINVYYVRDNGIGIEAKNHDKIFRIFARLNREEDYGSGTGAGLSFVRKIVESYGGSIVFTSSLGQGTTFYFTLPKTIKQQPLIAA